MDTSYEIERKFLVSDADLRDLSLELTSITSTYLDTDKIFKIGSSLGLPSRPPSANYELRASKLISDESTKFLLTSKVGPYSITRAESTCEIDASTYEDVVHRFGVSQIRKKRFKFTYLRKLFELDVYQEPELIMLEVELNSETELFAVPPFVSIIKEVTGDPMFYNKNISLFGVE